MEMAREFKKQIPAYELYTDFIMVQTLRSYESTNQFVITDDTLTLLHDC